MRWGSVAIAGVVVAGVVTVYFGLGKDPEDVRQGAPIVAVTVPELGPTERAGEVAYNAKCASCHGADAAGRDGVAPPLVHRIYEPGHHGDQAFLVAAQLGARAHHWPFGDMPPVEGVTREDVGMIVSYVRALQRANGIE